MAPVPQCWWFHNSSTSHSIHPVNLCVKWEQGKSVWVQHTKRELLLWLPSQPLPFRLYTKHLSANLLVKSGGDYLRPPRGTGWCCLCTGTPGRLGKQDMKIHSFLQYHPRCLPTKSENAHTWRKKETRQVLASGQEPMTFLRSVCSWRLKGKQLTGRKEKHSTTQLRVLAGPLASPAGRKSAVVYSRRLQTLTCCGAAASAATSSQGPSHTTSAGQHLQKSGRFIFINSE